MNSGAPAGDEDDRAQAAASEDGFDRPRVVPSRELLQGRREVWIQHGETLYRLRVTSSGKLYLTK
jgi:hemin uptake protein HemP